MFERLKLAEVKSHAGCQLNEMADELADKGCTSHKKPVFPGQQKYDSLLLRVRASMRTSSLIDDDNTGHLLLRNGAKYITSEKHIFRQQHACS